MPLPVNVTQLSPMMKQYVSIKSNYTDAILFYRLGDFYEMFFDDAITVSKELELVLTGKDCGLEQRAPMCGIPFHSYESYLSRLVKNGHKVAICEQVEDPALAKGIVKREIIRVVTPGTVTDSKMLSDESNNYIASMYSDKNGFGLAFCDISTGAVEITQARYDLETVKSEISRFEPKEIIMNETAYNDSELAKFVDRQLEVRREMLYSTYYDKENTGFDPYKFFNENDVKHLEKLKQTFAYKALGALFKYLEETQLSGIKRIVKLNVYQCTQYVFISPQCRRNLELTQTIRSGERRGSLLWVMDKTETSMGKRMLKSWLEKPLMDCDAINDRLDSVAELLSDTVRLSRMRECLDGIFDIERMLTRVMYHNCTARDLIALVQSSKRMVQLRSLLSGVNCRLLNALYTKIDPFEDLAKEIFDTITDDPPAQMKDGGYIRSGADSEIDELRELLHNSKSVLSAMEKKLKEETGISNLKIGYNRVFGYYIEVSKGSVANVPDSFVRRQTLTTGERYITQELKDLETKILGASDSLDVLERRLFSNLRDKIETQLKRIQSTVDAVAAIDVLCGFAQLASVNNYCRPNVDNSSVIKLISSRHPVVEQVLTDSLFVPNDVLLDGKDNLVALITGPNMAGKSTYMRQTALIVIMAQMGSFVPAKSADIGIVDAVFSRIGASDDIFAGDSTFMVEMKEVAQILSKATKKSLIILDEIGRGTSTYDGMSIARAVVEYICRDKGLGARTMFATHYHELTVIDGEYRNVKNYNVSARKRNGELVFLRRIIHGPSDDSYGIEVAKLAGVPQEIIDRANRILEQAELSSGNVSSTVIVRQTGLGNSQKIMALLSAMDVESLTPIESMIKLNEIVGLARSGGENDA